ncbi:MAG: N-acetylneuraminate synthase [Candidatus Margulisiibacteriota bacterium]|jgi:N,N'-diacetyllegionaminate synthase
MKNKVFIIAEAGVNHNGSLKKAKTMIDAAAKCGVDCIKFQTFITENLVSITAPKANYQKKSTDKNQSQFEMLKKLELSSSDHLELIEYAKNKKVLFLSSPFDLESIDFLAKIGLSIFKIPSGEITNYPYLRKIAGLNRKVILSTGLSTLDEIQAALDVLTSAGLSKDSIILLHCTSEYPAPYSDVNLNAMLTLRDKFKVAVGYSDHTIGIEISLAAVALGAIVIEKHFTLDKNLDGPDHKSSLTPDELLNLVKAIRNIEVALGNGEKRPSQSELQNKLVVRKSIIANKDIKQGEIFDNNNITVKRPGNGISPMLWNQVIGQIAQTNFKKDEIIKL